MPPQRRNSGFSNRQPFRPPRPSNGVDNQIIPDEDTSEPEFMLAEITHEEAPTIPPKLLRALLEKKFEAEGTKINKDAMRAVEKYMDTFVKEAIHRAKFEREETDGSGARRGDAFLEVEDLEKMLPQLLLDF
ncbi:MAG: hypothetical protein M1819_005928 [Sarea resinae]|nr:MAG: hypothetical protein M1819_005928 [Sarea resinae]